MDFTRTLVIAPHPDDESIAAGGLLQRAVAAGAEVRVLVVTDGDNNPWPVRYLKKKLRVTDAGYREYGRPDFNAGRHYPSARHVPPAAG